MKNGRLNMIMKLLTTALLLPLGLVNMAANDVCAHETVIPKRTVDDKIGVNAFIDDPLSAIKVAGHVREYHNFTWTQEIKNENRYNPSYGGCWDFDSYYAMLYKAGIDVYPCIQGCSLYMHDPAAVDAGRAKQNSRPTLYGFEADDPAAYADHASVMYQYIARYGSVKVDESLLLLAEGQEAKTGLGYIKYIENANEPDKNWEGKNGHQSAEELAAMCSADYDGHEGRLGSTFGIKNADPSAQLVLGGLFDTENVTAYLDDMLVWFKNNRTDGKAAFDVINFHTYCERKSPEEDGLKQKCLNVTEWRDINLPGHEVWLSEFGWDTNPKTSMAAPDERTQGNWLVRAYLITFAAGIDRSTMYMLRDVDIVSSTKFDSCGLVSKKGEWNKKPSWYYVSALRNVLNGYVFDKVIEENDNIYIYRFKAAAADAVGETCYAVWSPTADGTVMEKYCLNIEDGRYAVLTELSDGLEKGAVRELQPVGAAVEIDISEAPVFVTTSSARIEYEQITPIPSEYEQKPDTELDSDAGTTADKEQNEAQNEESNEGKDTEADNENTPHTQNTDKSKGGSMTAFWLAFGISAAAGAIAFILRVRGKKNKQK